MLYDSGNDWMDEDYSQVQIVTFENVGHCYHDYDSERYADRLRNEVVTGDSRFQIFLENV